MSISSPQLEPFHSNSMVKNHQMKHVDYKDLTSMPPCVHIKNTAEHSITSFRTQLNAAARQLLCCCIEEKEADEAPSASGANFTSASHVTDITNIMDTTNSSDTVFFIEVSKDKELSVNIEVTEIEDTQQSQKQEVDAFQQAVELLTEEQENALLDASDLIKYNNSAISIEHLDTEELFLLNRAVLTAVRKKPRT